MEEKEFIIRGVTHDSNVTKVAILGVPDQPGIAHKIFSALANANIDVDMIVQSIRNTDRNINDMLFTIAKPEMAQAKLIIDRMSKEINAIGVLVEDDVAKVSVVGAGMMGSPGIAATMFGALAEAGINIQVISTSEISISCIVKADKVKEAVNAVHACFFPEVEE